MLLRIVDLHVKLGRKEILHGVCLTLERGQIMGLLGPNGAGKSTMIAAALGLLRAERGAVQIFNKDIATVTPPLRRQIGVLPERNGLYDWMSASDYLRFYAALYARELPASEIESRLERVGLLPRAGQAIGTFSQGMRQRLGLARALIGDPRLIILDEPTNGLDPRGRREIHDILLDLARNGAGILLATHLLDDVERLCSRIAIVVDGRTVAEGAIRDLVPQAVPVSRFRLRLADRPPADHASVAGTSIVPQEGEWWLVEIDSGVRPQQVWKALLADGWHIMEIRREAGGLEDLYLNLTERRAA